MYLNIKTTDNTDHSACVECASLSEAQDYVSNVAPLEKGEALLLAVGSSPHVYAEPSKENLDYFFKEDGELLFNIVRELPTSIVIRKVIRVYERRK